MTDQTNTQESIDNEEKTIIVEQNQSNRLTHFASILFAFVAIIMASITLWQNIVLKKNLAHVHQYDAALRTLKQSSLDNQTQLTQEQEIIAKLEHRLEAQNQEILRLKENTQKMPTTDNNSERFILQKAHFQLELAAMNAHWTNDSESSLTLLQEADNTLKQISNPSVYPIRQALASEIKLWQNRVKIDSVGILTQLDQAIEQINHLSLQQNELKINNPTNNTTKKANTWKDELEKNMLRLEKLVVIRHHESEINPLISPMHEAIIRDGLRLQLYEAKWAVLMQNDALYQLALKNAIHTCETTFSNQSTQSSSFIKNLSELSTLSLTETKPDANALKLINQLINQGFDNTENDPA